MHWIVSFIFLAIVALSSATITLTPNQNYYILQNTLSRISLNGTGFTTSLTTKLYFGSEEKGKDEYVSMISLSENEAYTDSFMAPDFDDLTEYAKEGKVPVYIKIISTQDNSTLFSDFTTPVAYLLQSVQDSLNEGCSQQDDLYLRQNIQVGQKLHGQVVNPNSWSFFQWDIDSEPLYDGSTYHIHIKFQDQKRPLGVFVKFTNIYNRLPEYIQPDGTSECPGYECELLTKGVPIFPHDGCDYDARILPCSLRYRGKPPAGAECKKDEEDTYTITSRKTRSGRYVIGIQGQGLITIDPSDKRRLGYCSDCQGFDNPEPVTFSIEIKSSSVKILVSFSVVVLCALVSFLV